jgi:pimeloyl-ACP methyl ester carboxylesterase
MITVGNASLEYVERGSGEPLVLVHGSASDYRTWHRQLDAFSAAYRTIAYSRRYHWPNNLIGKGEDYRMSQHVDDLGSLLRALDASPAHLVGHSYGAFLCILLALRAPRLVRTLTLAEPPVATLFVSDPPAPHEILRLSVTRPRTAIDIVRFGALGAGRAARAFRRGDSDSAVRAFAAAVFGSRGYDGLPDKQKTQARDNISNIEAEILGSGLAPLDDAELRRLRTPVLLLTGEHSIGLFRRLTDRLAELLPDAHRIEIPRASHLMQQDNSLGFNSAVLNFISGHRRDDAL